MALKWYIKSNGTSDYDGSGAPSTATGSVIVTFSGTRGSQAPVLTMYSRSDTADFVPVHSTSKFGRFKVNLANADNYYFKVSVPTGSTVDLSVVDA